MSSILGVFPKNRSRRHRSINSDEAATGSRSPSTCLTALSAWRRAGRIGRHADQDQPRRDPGATCRILRRHVKRLLQIAGRQPNRSVVPLDLREQLQSLGLERGRQLICVRLLGKLARIGEVAGLQERGGVAQGPPDE
jgi:hypothetical protein